MFAGHIGAGLALARAERRVNVAVFVAAAVLLDILLWLFILAGWESVVLAPDFTATHQPDFRFPYSHGLFAGVLWSVLFAAACAAVLRLPSRRWRLAPLLAAAVFSHWLLDALVHKPELPLLGQTSMLLGLGWWNHLPLALALESALAFAGLGLFLVGSGWARRRSLALAALVLLAWALTLAGMTLAPPPPSALAMAASSLATLAVVIVLAGWIGRQPTA